MGERLQTLLTAQGVDHANLTQEGVKASICRFLGKRPENVYFDINCKAASQEHQKTQFACVVAVSQGYRLAGVSVKDEAESTETDAFRFEVES